jgi:hypothetical protein
VQLSRKSIKSLRIVDLLLSAKLPLLRNLKQKVLAIKHDLYIMRDKVAYEVTMNREMLAKFLMQKG